MKKLAQGFNAAARIRTRVLVVERVRSSTPEPLRSTNEAIDRERERWRRDSGRTDALTYGITDARTHGRTGTRTHGRTEAWTHGRTHGRTDAWTHRNNQSVSIGRYRRSFFYG